MLDDGLNQVAKDVESGVAATARRHATEDFALVIGVDHYPNFRSLRGAVDDAIKFHDWVCAPDGGRVAASNARKILSTLDPLTPIQDQIDDRLLELMKAANTLGGGRRLYFYFSGHGATDDNQPAANVALLLGRWSKQLARVALSSRDYSDRLNGAGLFEEIAVFLDCCRSIGVGAVGLPPQITFSATGSRYPTRNFIAHATDPGRSAYEDLTGGQWQGVFTRRLLTILKQSPAGITAALLKDRLEREVLAEGTGQQADVINQLSPDASFGSGVLPQLHVTFRPGRKQVRLRGGSGQLIEQRQASSEPWRVSLPHGLYKLEDDTPFKLTFDHGPDEVTHVEF